MPKVVDHEARRRQIVDALWRVVARDGFSAVTVRSVAAEAHLNPTTVALAFESRTQLLVQAYADLSRRDDEQLDRLLRRGMSVEVLVEACLLALPLTPRRAQHTAVWVALLDAAGNDAIAARAVADFGSGVRHRIRELLGRAVDEGVLRTTLDLDAQVVVVHAILDGLSVQVACTRTPKRAAIRSALSEHFRTLAT